MSKLLACILVLFFISATASQAQLLISTVQGNEYIGIVIKQNKDSISIKTFDDIEIHFDRKTIESVIQKESRIERESGEVYIGHVSEMNDRELTIVTRYENEMIIRRDSIAIIEYFDNSSVSEHLTYRRSTGRIGKNAGGRDSTRRGIIKHIIVDPSVMLGLTAFSPGGINVVFGLQFGNAGFRISAGKKDDLSGFQCNLSKSIVKEEYLSSNLSLGMGSTTESKVRQNPNWLTGRNDEKYTESTLYLGGFLDINISIFFA